jgi:hypothetical protein
VDRLVKLVWSPVARYRQHLFLSRSKKVLRALGGLPVNIGMGCGCRRAPPPSIGHDGEFDSDRRARDLMGCPRNDDRRSAQAGVSPRGRPLGCSMSACDARLPAVRRPPDSRNRWSNGGAAGYTSRQRNTHSTESREVRYPWHPWFGRSVTVYEALSKSGHRVCRCGFDDQRNDRSLEVPTWMFDSSSTV